MDGVKDGRASLVAGGVAAVLASACCMGPLVLLAVGIGGAWIASLTALEPYRPIFVGLAVLALIFAGRRIFRPPEACQAGEVCAVPKVRMAYKLAFWLIAALVLLALVFPYLAPLFY